MPLYGCTGMRAHDLAPRGAVHRAGQFSRRRLWGVAIGIAGPLIVSRGQAEGVAAPVLRVAAVPDYVRDGIVLGFDVVSGRPKLLFNLPQAKLQKVALAASVLKLMTVFE